MSKKKTIFYDDPFYNYQEYWQGRKYENESDKIALSRLIKQIGRRGLILDIGGGFGRLVPVYSPWFKQCFLVDASEKLLNEAKKNCLKFPNLIIKKGFIEQLPFKDKFFDVVITVRTLHHLENPERAIKEIARVLKPGGFFILEFANKARFLNILGAMLKIDLNFISSHRPVNICQKTSDPPFFSFHPNQINTLLLTNGFKVIKTYSVSNFRRPWIKKIVPLRILVKLESLFSQLVSSFEPLKYFGPSIFILAQKA